MEKSIYNHPQHNTNGLPIELLQQWKRSKQTDEIAIALLAQYKLPVGTIIISTDSAGLTRLASDTSQIVVERLLHQTKLLIKQVGDYVGAYAPAVWAADNTQMIVPFDVPFNRVVAAFDMLNKYIDKMFVLGELLKLSIAIVQSIEPLYYIPGHGIYGKDANLCEHLAETEGYAGSLLVCPSHEEVLAGIVFGEKVEYEGRHVYTIHSCAEVDLSTEVEQKKVTYPTPYSSQFLSELEQYIDSEDEDFRLKMEHRCMHMQTVVLAHIQPTSSHHCYEKQLLEQLRAGLHLREYSLQLMRPYPSTCKEIKVPGGIAIYTFKLPGQAIYFAQQLRDEFSRKEIPICIGIDKGPVIVHAMPNGQHEICGSPVNKASKLAEDLFEPYTIFVTRWAALAPTFEAPMRHIRISDIDMEFYQL